MMVWFVSEYSKKQKSQLIKFAVLKFDCVTYRLFVKVPIFLENFMKTFNLEICLWFIITDIKCMQINYFKKQFNMSLCYRDFGNKIMPIKPVMKYISKLLDDRDKNVRDETKMLLVEIYRWIGPMLKPMMTNFKPLQVFFILINVVYSLIQRLYQVM